MSEETLTAIQAVVTLWDLGWITASQPMVNYRECSRAMEELAKVLNKERAKDGSHVGA